MKYLNKQDFEDRTLAIMRASHIFMDSGITSNIDEAFFLYQEILAEKERPLGLTRKTTGSRKILTETPSPLLSILKEKHAARENKV